MTRALTPASCCGAEGGGVRVLGLQAPRGCKLPHRCRRPPPGQVGTGGRRGRRDGAGGGSRGLRFRSRGAGQVPRLQPIVPGPRVPTSRQSPPRPASSPPGPLFPLARWPPPALRLPPARTRPAHACAGPARGPSGLAVRGPACALTHSASSAPMALEGRDKALWEAGFGLMGAGGGHGGARDLGRGPANSGSTFPSSPSAALPVLRGFP